MADATLSEVQEAALERLLELIRDPDPQTALAACGIALGVRPEQDEVSS